MMQSLVTLLYFIIWTIIAVAVPGDIRFIYVYPVDGWRQGFELYKERAIYILFRYYFTIFPAIIKHLKS
jgi:hypothetical protein